MTHVTETATETAKVIAKLNADAQAMPDFAGDRVACYQRAARDAGFTLLKGGDGNNDSQAELYGRGPVRVNLWVQTSIDDTDSLGFDDQVDHWDDADDQDD